MLIIFPRATLFLANLPIYILKDILIIVSLSLCDLIVLIETSGLAEPINSSDQWGWDGNTVTTSSQSSIICVGGRQLSWWSLWKQVAHTYDPSIWESEAGDCPWIEGSWGYSMGFSIILSHIHRQTLFQNNSNNGIRKTRLWSIVTGLGREK